VFLLPAGRDRDRAIRPASAAAACPLQWQYLPNLYCCIAFLGKRDAKVRIDETHQGNSMSIEADFTPPRPASPAAVEDHEAVFPLSTSLNIVFSAYEDRLVLRSRRVNREPVNVLMTRRMTIIVLAQLLANLPELSGLDKTPAQYWQEVLQMAHQKALESGRKAPAGEQGAAADASADEGRQAAEAAAKRKAAQKKSGKLEGGIYLATSLTMQLKDEQLIMAITGLPMPCAMTEPCEREPLFAMPLQVENVHQLIQLIIDKAQEADWHLPLNLPWLESPSDAPATTLGLLH